MQIQSPSLPVRGAWIEMISETCKLRRGASLPVRGAWIEIALYEIGVNSLHGSLPVRGAWIEISFARPLITPLRSLPVRGAWIEIYILQDFSRQRRVAPRAGSVD